MGRIENHKEDLVNQIAEHYSAILKLVGEDPEREGQKNPGEGGEGNT